MLRRMRAGQSGSCHRRRQAFGTAMLAALLVFSVLLIAGESLACSRDFGADGTIATQIVSKTTVETIDARANYHAVVPAVAFAAVAMNSSEGAGCCGGFHSSGGKCSEANCSWCSATLPPETFDIGLQLKSLTPDSSEQASLLFLKPSSIFRPPRLVA